MRILGADLRTGPQVPAQGSLVALGPDGLAVAVRHPSGLGEIASSVVELAAGEPFLLAVGLPVVVPEKPARFRPVERLVRRRLGHRLQPGGRSSADTARGSTSGEALLAALAAAGAPCLPYPDRDGHVSGLAEIHPALALKVLLWEGSTLARAAATDTLEALFRSFQVPDYRPRLGAKAGAWAERAGVLDLVLRALGALEGYDFRPAREALAASSSGRDVERAASILDACLLAGTARRYMDRPETCLFLGDRETGYAILPADPLVRRLALRERAAPAGPRLFPGQSLRAKLEEAAELRPAGLLPLPGRPERLEAVFRQRPLYEFDNVDEMLWWKHCRHLKGPELPTDGLEELVVTLEGIAGGSEGPALRLLRSRHRTLSFRFDPAALWRRHISPRDGKAYAFTVWRAVYAAAPQGP